MPNQPQHARPDDEGIFVGAMAAIVAVAVVSLVKKEESFVCPAESLCCLAVPAVGASVRGHLRDSQDSCGGSFKEGWLVAGDIEDGGVDEFGIGLA